MLRGTSKRINRIRKNVSIHKPKKKNKHEEGVRSWFEKNGYSSLARGWPDFVFWKDDEIIFVEVKPPGSRSIKTHQFEIKQLLERLEQRTKSLSA